MQRITISIGDGLARDFARLMRRRQHANRSEAMRDLLRRELEADRQRRETRGHCVAALSYVYDHSARKLAERLAEAQHAHHDLVASTMQVHLDHVHSLETLVLKGPAAVVRAFAESLLAERGVRHGQINVISVQKDDEHGPVAAHHHHRGHLHLTPRS